MKSIGAFEHFLIMPGHTVAIKPYRKPDATKFRQVFTQSPDNLTQRRGNLVYKQ